MDEPLRSIRSARLVADIPGLPDAEVIPGRTRAAEWRGLPRCHVDRVAFLGADGTELWSVRVDRDVREDEIGTCLVPDSIEVSQ
jgi:hypothetical protein